MKTNLKRLMSLALVILMLSAVCFTGKTPIIETKADAASSTNLALGKSITFGCGSSVDDAASWGITAIKNGLGALTDGVNNSPNYWVNGDGTTFNPYIGIRPGYTTGPYTFVVNLGELATVDSFSTYFTDRYQAEAPASVTYSISTDGVNWTYAGAITTAQSSYSTQTATDSAGNVSSFRIYKYTLNIDATQAMYVKATMTNGDTTDIGFGEFEVYGTLPEIISEGITADCLSVGYSSMTSDNANYGITQVKKYITALTDGVTNSPNYWANNGYYVALNSEYLTGPYTITMYLGGGQASAQSVSTYYLEKYETSYAPDSVDYSVSADGINWKKVGTVTSDMATISTSGVDGSDSYKIKKYTLNMSESDITYIRASFNENSIGKIFMGEFEVRGTTLGKSIVNLASGRMSSTSNYTYEITGGGNTSHPTNTNYTVAQYEKMFLSRLTDGAYGSYVPVYRNDDRIITLDLGAVRNITSLWMDFASYESGGVYLPSKVKYYISEDGIDYYKIKEIKKSETTYNKASGSYGLYWYKTSTLCVNARYVKVVFPTSVNVYPDELIVYGYSSASSQANDITGNEKYDPLANYVGEMADSSLSGGVRNEYLAYSGWSYGSDGTCTTTKKSSAEYLAAIAYVDMNDVAQDWLYDGVTLIPHHHTSGGKWNLYQASKTSSSYYADKDDWYEWLCYSFGETTSGSAIMSNGEQINLPALEKAAAKAKAALGDDDYKVKVKLSIFPAVHFQSNWGTLDGKNIDFSVSGAGSVEAAVANRKAAYQWYIETALAMWEEAGFEHLEFAGFYYFEEAIREGADSAARDTIMALTDLVHNTATPSTNTLPAFDDSQGGKLYIYQIPFYQAEGYYEWKTYGFDYAIMQPNLSFTSASDGLTQLKTCADSSAYYGLGFEMEFGGLSDTYIDKFQYYLDYGKEYGYIDTVLGWYMGTWGLYQLSNGSATSNHSSTRYVYDSIYDFVLENRISTATVGDVNGDGTLSINDATKIQLYLAKRLDLSDGQKNVADVNGDGVISVRDATRIRLILAKIVTQ